ncbi:MAG TPA: hypothetical protein VJ419_00750 [Gaiellaceae bacterium]|jgi:hypothetical protein|nr:hypothetical protein [Gaiellaceae bacterium]
MRWLVVAVVAVVATGCGGSEKTVGDTTKAEMAKVQTTCAEGVNCASDRFQPFRNCTHASRGFRACTTYRERSKETGIYRRARDGWRKFAGAARSVGWWRRVIAEPSRTVLLGQWSGECETQTTYIVERGRARAIFAGSESYAVGWSTDGRARVRVPMEAPDPRGDVRAGIYLVDPQTLAHTLERPLGRGPAC